MRAEKGACSTGLRFCLCQLGNASLVLPWQCRPGLEWDSPSSALLWEAGVRPASGAPIWSYDNRSSISTCAPGFSWSSLTHLWNTRHGCEYDKRALMLMQHPFNQPATLRTSWLKKNSIYLDYSLLLCLFCFFSMKNNDLSIANTAFLWRNVFPYTARSSKTGSDCKKKGGFAEGELYNAITNFWQRPRRHNCEWGVAPPDAKLHQWASLDTNKSCQTLQKAKRAQFIPAG